MIKKIQIFDFDETIVNFQTPDEFLLFVLSKYNNRTRLAKLVINSDYLIKVLSKILQKKRLKKILLVFLTKGIPCNNFDKLGKEFYSSRIRPNLYPNVLKIYQEYAANNLNSVIIISAGFSYYIQPFINEFGGDKLIANSIRISGKNFKSTGSLAMADCYGEQKVTRLFSALQNHHYEYEFESTFSDCLSDLPIFKLSKNKFLINNGNIKSIKI